MLSSPRRFWSWIANERWRFLSSKSSIMADSFAILRVHSNANRITFASRSSCAQRECHSRRTIRRRGCSTVSVHRRGTQQRRVASSSEYDSVSSCATPLRWARWTASVADFATCAISASGNRGCGDLALNVSRSRMKRDNFGDRCRAKTSACQGAADGERRVIALTDRDESLTGPEPVPLFSVAPGWRASESSHWGAPAIVFVEDASHW